MQWDGLWWSGVVRGMDWVRREIGAGRNGKVGACPARDVNALVYDFPRGMLVRWDCFF